MSPTICALKAVTTEPLKLKKVGTIIIIKLIESLKSKYTLSELIFADLADSDLKKIELRKYSK